MIVGAVGVVLVSVVTTLLLAGGGRLGWFDKSGSGYINVTFTDAVMSCEEYTREQFGTELKTLEIDNHSSRFDNKTFLYKIFIEVGIEPRGKSTGMNFINCFVKSSNGKITKYESWEEKEGSSAPSGGSGSNPFGWPR